MGSGNFVNFIKGIWQLFLDFIGFLFDIDFNETDELENPFSNVPTPVTLNDKNKVVLSEDADMIKTAFGKDAARYINRLRREADFLVKEHSLQQMDSILTMLPPQKLTEANLAPSIINNIIESIYNQIDGDVILKPGKINVFVNDNGVRFAEIYMECYKPVDELVRI